MLLSLPNMSIFAFRAGFKLRSGDPAYLCYFEWLYCSLIVMLVNALMLNEFAVVEGSSNHRYYLQPHTFSDTSFALGV